MTDAIEIELTTAADFAARGQFQESFRSLERAHMTANKNAIPFDPEKPAITSGIRLGTPAATTRGFGAEEFREIGRMIDEVLTGLSGANEEGGNALVEQAVGKRVQALCARFPIYPH